MTLLVSLRLQGNFVQPNRIILDHDALLQYDTQINPGEELTYSYSQIPPTIGILSAAGETNLDAFDPATDTLGTVTDMVSTTLLRRSQWDLRYVSFGGYIGANGEKYALTGWDDNATIPASEGTLTSTSSSNLSMASMVTSASIVGGVLLKTSLNTFSGAQTLTLAGFDDQATD